LTIDELLLSFNVNEGDKKIKELTDRIMFLQHQKIPYVKEEKGDERWVCALEQELKELNQKVTQLIEQRNTGIALGKIRHAKWLQNQLKEKKNMEKQNDFMSLFGKWRIRVVIVAGIFAGVLIVTVSLLLYLGVIK
jgi:DNA repair exonuclease SbcCD ATPase subunit